MPGSLPHLAFASFQNFLFSQNPLILQLHQQPPDSKQELDRTAAEFYETRARKREAIASHDGLVGL